MRVGRLWVLLIVGSLATAANGMDSTEIAFKLVQGFAIVARGGIGSSDGLNLLVDTGAVPVF
jgi:hypothetical protein